MTRYGLSEVGMEARRQMISEEGRAYHRALERTANDNRNTAGGHQRYLLEAQLHGPGATNQGVRHEEHHYSHSNDSTV